MSIDSHSRPPGKAMPPGADESAATALALVRGGNRAAAAAMLQRLLARQPDDPHALHVMSLLLQARGELAAAVAHAARAAWAAPGNPGLHYMHGNLLHDAGQPAEAARAYAIATRLKPDFFEAFNNLGLALQDSGDLSAAAEALQRARALRPDSTSALANLVGVLEQSGRAEEAHALLSGVLPPALDDRLRALRSEIGDRLARQSALANRTAEAVARYRQLAALDPADWRARIGARLTLPAIHASAAAQDAARAAYGTGLDALLTELDEATLAALTPGDCLAAAVRDNFLLAYQGEDDRALQARYGTLMGRLLDRALPEFRQPLARPVVPGRPLRIGFAGCFFRDCTVGHYFASWITDLPGADFECTVYLLGGPEDEMTRTICQRARRVRLDGPLGEAAAVIRADAPDLLVFPELGMNGRTLALAGLRLAPVQCAGWGHPVTSGLATVDHYLSCALMEPPEATAHYTENLCCLPGLGTRYARPAMASSRTRASFGLPDDAHLYLMPHALFKLHPENDATVARILAADPHGLLVLCAGETEGMTRDFLARLHGVLGEHGVAPERCRLQPYLARGDYLALNRVCDVLLDPTRWSGGNVTLDAIASGLPIVTRWGRFMRGRQTAGLLRAIGCEFLIADDEDAYVALALRLAGDPELRAATARQLVEGARAIFDDAEPVAALAQSFRAMLTA